MMLSLILLIIQCASVLFLLASATILLFRVVRYGYLRRSKAAFSYNHVTYQLDKVGEAFLWFVIAIIVFAVFVLIL